MADDQPEIQARRARLARQLEQLSPKDRQDFDRRAGWFTWSTADIRREDVVQQAILAVWEHPADDERFTLCQQVMKQIPGRFLDAKRKARAAKRGGNEATVSLDALNEEGAAFAEDSLLWPGADEPVTPERYLELKQIYRRLFEALPADEHGLLSCRLRGLSAGESQAELKLTPNELDALRRRLDRSLREFGKAWSLK